VATLRRCRSEKKAHGIGSLSAADRGRLIRLQVRQAVTEIDVEAVLGLLSQRDFGSVGHAFSSFRGS
jgi:hypothetical protein